MIQIHTTKIVNIFVTDTISHCRDISYVMLNIFYIAIAN